MFFFIHSSSWFFVYLFSKLYSLERLKSLNQTYILLASLKGLFNKRSSLSMRWLPFNKSSWDFCGWSNTLALVLQMPCNGLQPSKSSTYTIESAYNIHFHESFARDKGKNISLKKTRAASSFRTISLFGCKSIFCKMNFEWKQKHREIRRQDRN